MVADVAPPKNTGGGGFVFENDVCAWLLACVLTGERVFGPNLGEPIRLDFQRSRASASSISVGLGGIIVVGSRSS